MIKSAVINASTNGDNQIVAGVTGMRIRVVNFVLIPNATVVCKFTDGGGGTALTGPMSITTAGLFPGFAPPIPPGNLQGHFETSQGNDLTLNLGAGTQVSGYVNYTLEK